MMSTSVEVIDEDSTASEDQDDFEAIRLLTNIICDENKDEELQIEAVKTIKGLFTSTSRITLEAKVFQHLIIGEILDDIVELQKEDADVKEEILEEYCESILKYVAATQSIEKKLILQLEWIFDQLKKKERKNLEDALANVWRVFEENFIYEIDFLNKLLDISHDYLEETVINWMRNKLSCDNDLKLEYFVAVSSQSPKIFQCITSIFNEFLNLTNGEDKIMELLGHYVNSVVTYCDENEHNIFSLYPKDCCRLVSLLTIDPEDLIKTSSVRIVDHKFSKTHSSIESGLNVDSNEILVTEEVVLNFMYEKFTADKEMTTMLLTHYPQWMALFVKYINER